MSRQQSHLGLVVPSKSDSGQTLWSSSLRKRSGEGESNRVVMNSDMVTEGEAAVKDNSQDRHYLRRILASIGSCIRLSLPALRLFERVHLVFYRSTEWTEKSLTTMVLARISRRNFPQYIVSRSASIFTSRSTLIEFEAALRTQYRVDNILESSEASKNGEFEEILSIFDGVYPRWKVLVETEQRKEDCVYENGEGAYLRHFSPAWVYTRIIHKVAYVLGKLKMHQREHQILTELLSQQLFHVSRRGAWYQRKALIEENYMAAINKTTTEDFASKKRYWKRVSLQTCEEGLQDRNCHAIYHCDLQKRIRKLEKNLKVAKREQHDFGHVTLHNPVERTVLGILVKRTSQNLESGRGKTVWINEQDGGRECSVESLCLSEYRRLGWQGFHSEGGIITTLFAYLFFDVLFAYIPNVFQTPFQTCPLDLHTDAFYPSRALEINRRLVEIANGDAERLIREVDSRERESKTSVIGLDWGFELEDLVEIVRCFQGSALAMICKVMAQEYRQRGGGVPDLLLWDSRGKEVMFAEVKSINDRLSDTQRLWIHVLISSGVAVEICHAVAKEERRI
jgi:fanconi-associated nuclease 1